MGLPVPFISGKDATFRVFINGKETILNVKSFNVNADVTKAQDGVNGEDRDRPMSFLNLYTWTCTGFIDRATQVDDILAYVANTDSQVAPFDVAVGIRFKIQDGTKKAYVAKESVIDDFGTSSSDRKDRLTFNMSGRSRYMDPVPTL